tara:strand:- start:18 stop:887 length:870 start_codon:yes stop_codon:yes gene_type:complete
MPYIGKSPVSGGFHKLGNLTASATATYALTLNGAAYFPETANQLLVSLNGVIQAPQDSFTVSGSNIVFASALTSSDSIDFVVALGDVLGVGSVTDGAITTAKLGNNAVTDAKLASTLDLSSKALTMPTGSVLQVKHAQKTNTGDVALSADTDTIIHTDLQVTITPTSANSIIKLEGQIFGEHDNAGNVYNHMVFFYRDTTKLAAPNVGSRTGGVATMTRTYHTDNSDSTPEYAYYAYFDPPSTTSAITYKLGMRVATSETFYINRTVSDVDNSGTERGISFISATEIAG